MCKHTKRTCKTDKESGREAKAKRWESATCVPVRRRWNVENGVWKFYDVLNIREGNLILKFFVSPLLESFDMIV